MGSSSSKKSPAKEESEAVKSAENSADYGSIEKKTESSDPKQASTSSAEAPSEEVASKADESEKKAEKTTSSKTKDKSSSKQQLIETDGQPSKYDPDFTGPLKDRSCTDILCTIVFNLFIFGWIVVAVFAFIFGDPKQLMFPTDTHGKKCGFDPGVEQKPYLHFFDISQCANPIVLIAGCPTPQVCVEKCPDANFFATPFGQREDLCVEEVRARFYCKPGVNPTERAGSGSGFARTCANLLLQDCAPYTVISAPIMDRCVPTLGVDQAVNGTLVDSNNQTMGELSLDKILQACKNLGSVLKLKGLGEDIGKDFQSSWWVIVTALIICMCVSLLWILLMRWFTSIMVWTALFGSLGAVIYGCVYTYLRYDSLRKAEVKSSDDQRTNLNTVDAFNNQAGSLLGQENTWLAFFICLTVLGVILLLLIIILFKRLRIAIEVIEEASKAVTSIMTSLFFPLVPWTLQLVVVVTFATLALHIASMGLEQYRVTSLGDDCCSNFALNATCDPEVFNRTCRSQCPDAECTFMGYRKLDSIPYLHFYNLFALLWVMFFVSALGEMVLAGAFAGWYWTFDKSKHLPTLPIISSFHRTMRQCVVKFHVGTLAFGALIIAIIRLIRLILDYIDKKCQKYPGNQVVKVIMCCCKCCMWCLEKFMKFINRNAYIMCAIYGKNFCTSAKDGFNLIMRNILRVLAVNSVCDFLMFLGKVLITAGITVGSFYFLDNRIPIKGLDTVVPETENSWVPTLTIAAGCYFITSLFFSVYEMAVDTIFLCFLEDIERNDGSAEKPYYMSKDLMKLIGKRNKPPPKKE